MVALLNMENDGIDQLEGVSVEAEEMVDGRYDSPGKKLLIKRLNKVFVLETNRKRNNKGSEKFSNHTVKRSVSGDFFQTSHRSHFKRTCSYKQGGKNCKRTSTRKCAHP